jgi:hypothetical protein
MLIRNIAVCSTVLIHTKWRHWVSQESEDNTRKRNRVVARMSPRCHAARCGFTDLDRVEYAWRVADYACYFDRPKVCEGWHVGLAAKNRGLTEPDTVSRISSPIRKATPVPITQRVF